jgi:hypothetical protein
VQRKDFSVPEAAEYLLPHPGAIFREQKTEFSSKDLLTIEGSSRMIPCVSPSVLI